MIITPEIILSVFIVLLFIAVFIYLLKNSNKKDIALSNLPILQERIANKEITIQELKKTIQEQSDHIVNLQNSLNTHIEKASKFEQKSLRIPELESEIDKQQIIVNTLNNQIIELTRDLSSIKSASKEEQKASAQRIEELKQLSQTLTQTFKSLSLDALKSNNHSFMELAKTEFEKITSSSKNVMDLKTNSIQEMVKPVKEYLEKVDANIKGFDKNSSITFSKISEQIKNLSSDQLKLKTEADNLVKALRMPNVRGRWGEIQLKRVVEVAGMLEYCDFKQQVSKTVEDKNVRPDMIIQLPNKKVIIVDSKAPLQAYLESIEAENEDIRIKKLQKHAKQIKDHLDKLSKKSYWSQFNPTPEFVVMFLPGESFFSAALEHDPELIEFGAAKKVILATPTTLIALLRSVAYGWKEEKIGINAQKISDLGKQLYERLLTLSVYFEEIKKGLDRSIDGYNSAVSSFESRVLVSARKFNQFGISTNKEIESPLSIEKQTRSIQKQPD